MHFVFFTLSDKELHTAGAAYVKSLVPCDFLIMVWKAGHTYVLRVHPTNYQKDDQIFFSKCLIF